MYEIWGKGVCDIWDKWVVWVLSNLVRQPGGEADRHRGAVVPVSVAVLLVVLARGVVGEHVVRLRDLDEDVAGVRVLIGVVEQRHLAVRL